MSKFSHDIDPRKLTILSQEAFALLSQKEKNLSEAQLRYLISFGLLAPSSHNTVPERCKVIPKKQTVEIWLDTRNVLPESDPTGKQALMGIGCVLENIKVACDYYGIQMKEAIAQEYTPRSRYVFIAKLLFAQSSFSSHEQSLLQAVLERKVIRAEYDDTIKIPKKLQEQMKEIVNKQYPQLEFRLITEKDMINKIGKLQEAADRRVFEDKKFVKELSNWLLPNDATDRVNGIKGKEFGFDDAFAKRIHEGLSGKIALLPDEIAGFAMSGRILFQHSSAIAILLSPDDSLAHCIQVGKAYETIALFLQQTGYANAIHAGMSEVHSVTRMLSSLLQTNNRPMMIFRIGQPLHASDWHRPSSSRPTLNQVLIK